jgi:hypothetical protein
VIYKICAWLCEKQAIPTPNEGLSELPRENCDGKAVLRKIYLILNEAQNKTKQNKTKQNKTKQNKTKQNKTKQNKTKQNKTRLYTSTITITFLPSECE